MVERSCVCGSKVESGVLPNNVFGITDRFDSCGRRKGEGSYVEGVLVKRASISQPTREWVKEGGGSQCVDAGVSILKIFDINSRSVGLKALPANHYN